MFLLVFGCFLGFVFFLVFLGLGVFFLCYFFLLVWLSFFIVIFFAEVST